jgi:hypothetical protein
LGTFLRDHGFEQFRHRERLQICISVDENRAIGAQRQRSAQETATISVASPFSFRRTASSTAISSKGFIDIFTLAVSTPEPSGLTRTLTLKSTTRFTGTRIFMK